MSMRFVLDEIIIDEIIFYMENQDGDFVLDTERTGIVDILNNDYEEKPDFSNDERFITLPEWNSNDGFRLMEKFTSGLKNPVARQELSDALNRKKGVFRAFRNILSQYPETEKMWYAFKEQKMKNAVLEWYNALREEWGLEPVGIEPEDNSSLIMEDFIICKGENDFSFFYETVNGESAGEVKAELEKSGNPACGADVLHINHLEINPAYRGMGLGKTLLAKVLEKADEQNLDVTIDLPSVSDFFSRSLHLENFKPVMKKFLRKTDRVVR